MRIKYESELLDESVRKRLIEEIEGAENKTRKYLAYRRYMCYKDKTSTFVVDALLRQFDYDTVLEMRYALSNISIVKKVIDKLARVYSNGVDRSISNNTEATNKLKKLEKALDVNTALKKANRFLKLQKNVDLFIKPCPIYETENSIKWTLKLEALSPYLYDVVEHQYDRTKALAVILSDYQPPSLELSRMDGKHVPVSASNSLNPSADGKDQAIADKPSDQKMSDDKQYVFWTKSYHFTCDKNGKIIPDEKNPENKNPLGVFNHINFAIDQDGAFWAEGGDDLIEGAVLINSLITHTMHVGTVQGYGQFYMTGENLPRSIKIGPTKAIVAEYKKDEQAEPKMGFLNANPQLDSLRSLVEMYVALYLTTNNLSTTGVSTQLSGGNTLPSGIALILDKAESLEDTQDQRQIFVDKEADIFDSINSFLKVYTDNNLVDELKGLKLPDDFKKDFNVKFFDPTPIMSEKEKLDNMQLRKDMGIDTMISILMQDDSSLTEEQAEEKLKKLVAQRIKEKMIEQEAMKQMGVEYDEATDTNDTDNTVDNNNIDKPSDDMDDDQVDETNRSNAKGSGTPTVGDTAGNSENVQQLALNGAQVTALVDIVEKVAAGTLPRDSAVNMIVTSFNVQVTDAEKILGSAGNGFKIETPEPVAVPKAAPNEDSKQDDQ